MSNADDKADTKEPSIGHRTMLACVVGLAIVLVVMSVSLYSAQLSKKRVSREETTLFDEEVTRLASRSEEYFSSLPSDLVYTTDQLDDMLLELANKRMDKAREELASGT